MQVISLVSASRLTGRSERTLWRWIAEGSLLRAPDNIVLGKAMVQLESVKPFISIPINTEDFALIASADAGDPEAQNDLALLLLINDSKEQAIFWFEKSAKQNYPDAMHWLGRVYIDATGDEKNENLGLMWLANAASQGHMISIAQMDGIRTKISTTAP